MGLNPAGTAARGGESPTVLGGMETGKSRWKSWDTLDFNGSACRRQVEKL